MNADPYLFMNALGTASRAKCGSEAAPTARVIVV